MNLSIETISNGILITTRWGQTEYCKNTQELFDMLLFKLESKCMSFRGDSYGCVHIFYKPDETFTSPSEKNPV